MKRVFCLLILILVSLKGFSQDDKLLKAKLSAQQQRQFNRDSINRGNQGTTKVILGGKTKYTDYKILSLSKDTTYIDTTLTIQKHYKFNFTRRDNFELLPFHNIGQTFNSLYCNTFSSFLPSFSVWFKLAWIINYKLAKQFFFHSQL